MENHIIDGNVSLARMGPHQCLDQDNIWIHPRKEDPRTKTAVKLGGRVVNNRSVRPRFDSFKEHCSFSFSTFHEIDENLQQLNFSNECIKTVKVIMRA